MLTGSGGGFGDVEVIDIRVDMKVVWVGVVLRAIER
jgi:hypothetical protein